MRKDGRKKRMAEHHKMLRDLRKLDKKPRCKRCGDWFQLRPHKERGVKQFYVCRDVAACRANVTRQVVSRLQGAPAAFDIETNTL